MKRVAFYTLGCKVNFCETESLQALFEQAGYRVVDFEEEADVYVINSCTVTAISDHKSRKMIRRARARAPSGLIVVTGCYAQGFSDEVKEILPVDLVVGTHGRKKLPQLVELLSEHGSVNLVRPYPEEALFEELPLYLKKGRARGFLKVQEGCNMSCSYCIVPRVRGPLRSMSLSEVLARARAMVRAGFREIVLTGTHLGLYGKEKNGVTLATLLEQMEAIRGLPRIRLSSLEPTDISRELVDWIAGSAKICPHLHIPLQSGDGEILERMNRAYSPPEFAYLVRWIRQRRPEIAVSTDVIVGFPGENEEHHRRSLQFMEELEFSRLHIFKFSARPGTPAAAFPGQVTAAVKELRSNEMIAIGESMAGAFRSGFIGKCEEVLLEKITTRAGELQGEGFTPHYLRVRAALPSKGRRWRGKLVPVRLEREEDGCLTGAIDLDKL